MGEAIHGVRSNFHGAAIVVAEINGPAASEHLKICGTYSPEADAGDDSSN